MKSTLDLDHDEIAKFQANFAKIEARRLAAIENNPDNGKLGWWRVVGMRHSALARASTAAEAIAKADAAEIVSDWECAEAFFFCVELPEVFSA